MSSHAQKERKEWQGGERGGERKRKGRGQQPMGVAGVKEKGGEREK